MFELFCPQHGIPAFISWVVLGCDPQLFVLTFRMWCARVFNVIGGLK